MNPAQRAPMATLAENEEIPVALRRLMAVTEASFEQRAQLERALKTRIVVEQAKGILAERFRVTPGEAFEMLRGTARFRQMSVHDLAGEVVADRDTPTSILTYIQRTLTEQSCPPSASDGRRDERSR